MIEGGTQTIEKAWRGIQKMNKKKPGRVITAPRRLR